MMFMAVVLLYVGTERIEFKDELGPYKSRENCEIRTAQMLREEIWPLIETMSISKNKRVKELCILVGKVK